MISLWTLIERAKMGQEYLDLSDRYNNLCFILSQYSKDEIRELELKWKELQEQLISQPNFIALVDKLDGGDNKLVPSTIANFLIFLGEEVYSSLIENSLEKALKVVINYIKQNNIEDDDYSIDFYKNIFTDILGYFNDYKESKDEDLRYIKFSFLNGKVVNTEEHCFEKDKILFVCDLFKTLPSNAQLGLYHIINAKVNKNTSKNLL